MEKIKNFFKTLANHKKTLIWGLAAVLVIVGVICGFAAGRYAKQPKFQSLTVELGTESVSLQDFLTQYGKAGKASFVSDPSVIDLNRVGSYELTLQHGTKQETVTLTVCDTTAPEASFSERYCIADYTIPDAQTLVSEIRDEDTVSIFYDVQPVIPMDYADMTVRVVVEDASGNRTTGESILSFRWLREEYNLELGQILTKEQLLFNPLRDQELVDQGMLDFINESGEGTYIVTGKVGQLEQTCTVVVADTKGPELVLQTQRRYPGKDASVDDFVVSVSDASEVTGVRMVGEVDFDTLGEYPVTIEAEDSRGNVTSQQTTLWITNDMKAPELKGPLTTVYTDKNTEPELLEGFSAKDKVDGVCEVTCDTSKVDLTQAGTYYVTYTATDASGNVASAKRKVVVNHDEEDTKAMIKEIAAGLSDDVEEIRDYVRKTIRYNTNWGGDDPVWYGFTTKGGNCYVHALCLQMILEEKGYETQLIWVTAKSHYWLIVKLPEGWRHIDATPSAAHSRYSIMTDDLRYATLNGRNWDRSAWPACVEETEGDD